MARFLCLIAVLATAQAAAAGPGEAPGLAAASNFGQSWEPDMLDAAQALGVADLRDEIHWHAVEAGGSYRFATFLTQYPALLAARGMRMTLLAGGEHPDHDHGTTPTTPEAVEAFAQFAAATAARFPAIEAVEVGNEMNSDTFASGPMRVADLTGKAAFYTALLRATHDAVRSERPDIRIIGGAAHSIPLAWFAALSQAGAAQWMDSVALHTYTTPAEQLRRQVALLREVPGFETLPIEVTEFGTPDAAEAPGYLLKSYCQMALSGVTQVVWYPLNPRGDGLIPLIGADGDPTEVGRTFRFIQDELAGRTVEDAAPDPFTYGCRFGDRALLLWGAERDVSLQAPGLVAVDPVGRPVATPRLSRETPLIVLSRDDAAIDIGETVRLGPQTVIADSYDQFAYPGRAGDAFERFARVGGTAIPFELGPGQETNGVPWTPYLRTAQDGMLRMNAEFVMPSMWETGGVEIVHAYRAAQHMPVAIDAMVEPGPESTDGVVLSFRHNGATLQETTVTERAQVTVPRVDLAAGDVLEIIVGPGASSEGDSSRYRFTLRRAD